MPGDIRNFFGGGGGGGGGGPVKPAATAKGEDRVCSL